MGGELFAIYEDGMLKARNKIDPYNVALSFPDHVRVEFVGSGDMMLLNNIQWRFADGRGLEYLQLPQVITGEIGEAAMFLIAGFTVVSETIWVNFPIKPRHIDISVGGGADIKPLDGGIIYLIKVSPYSLNWIGSIHCTIILADWRRRRLVGSALGVHSQRCQPDKHR